MHIKTVVFLVVATMAVCTIGGPQDDDNARYKFEYGVNDPHTHDSKEHRELRDGNNVVGGYTLIEPDGTRTVVKYQSAPHKGFEAVVERRGHAKHPAHKGQGEGAISWVGMTHWHNQGPEEEGHKQ